MIKRALSFLITHNQPANNRPVSLYNRLHMFRFDFDTVVVSLRQSEIAALHSVDLAAFYASSIPTAAHNGDSPTVLHHLRTYFCLLELAACP